MRLGKPFLLHFATALSAILSGCSTTYSVKVATDQSVIPPAGAIWITLDDMLAKQGYESVVVDRNDPWLKDQGKEHTGLWRKFEKRSFTYGVGHVNVSQYSYANFTSVLVEQDHGRPGLAKLEAGCIFTNLQANFPEYEVTLEHQNHYGWSWAK